MPLTRTEVAAKTQEHKKMAGFYNRYARALDVVESFDTVRGLVESHDYHFCQHPSCYEVLHWQDSGKLCFRHESMMNRRTVRDCLHND